MNKFCRKLMFVEIAISIIFLVSSAIVMAEPTPDEIMQANFFVTKTKTLVSEQKMILENDKGQQRERDINTQSKLQSNGIDLSLVVRFNSPADVQGTTFLQIQNAEQDDDMWIYLPALKKVRRLVSSNKRDSFVGSDFSYGDVLTLRPALFSHILNRSEKLDNIDCYVVESVPSDESMASDIGYTRKVSWLRKDNFLELKIEYYDENNDLIKTQTAGDHKLIQEQPPRWIALKRQMINHQSGHKTLIVLTNIDTEKPIGDEIFTTRAIETQ